MTVLNHQEIQLVKTPVSMLEEIAPGVFILAFTRYFDFIPGQVVAINNGIEQSPRLYSISSGFADPEVKILFNSQEDGYLTTHLSRCNAGDRILVSKAFGNFTCREDDAWWIASGTGIAPFASMIFSGKGKNNTLIHGGKTLSSFYFQTEIAKKMGSNYIRCCSSECGNGVFEGKLTQYLFDQPSLPADKKYYICGKSEMVLETRDILINKGISNENIVAEIYS
jgi:ferredoxin/flavodoxin---NADP+ reductase